MSDTSIQRIVVGVDGSDCSKAALAWALWQAELSGAQVEAVSAYQDLTMYEYGLGDVPPPLPAESLSLLAQKSLDQSIEEVAAGLGHPVQVVTRVESGRAAEILPELAKGASMLVVGSHGHGSFAGMLLGSVSQHCVLHPSCPVVVVPSPVATVNA